MKKVLGPMLSIISGVVMFAFLSIHYMAQTAKGWVEGTEYLNAWELIEKADKEIDGSVFFKIMTIVLIVIASILILYGFVYLFANLKVLKIKGNLKLVNDFLMICLVAVVAVQLVALFSYSKTLSGSIFGEQISSSPAIGMWLNLGTSIVACLLSIFFTKSVKKSKRK